MGKGNKNKAHPGSASSGSVQKSPEKPANNVVQQPESPKETAFQEVAKQLESVNLQNGEAIDRDDVMAARKAKAAAKAEKAAKAAAKKAAEAAAKQGGEQPNEKKEHSSKTTDQQSSVNKEELAARKALAVQQRAQKAAKQGGAAPQNQKQENHQKEEPKSKSNLKQSSSSSSDTANNKEVRFGVTRSESEENLMVAQHHAERANTKIEIEMSDIRELLHPSFLPLFNRCESEELEGVDELCLLFLQCSRQFVRQFTDDYRKTWTDKGAESRLGNMMDETMRAQLSHLCQGDRYPLPYALANISRQLRKEMIKVGVPDERGHVVETTELIEWIDDSESNYFETANKAISQHLQAKIQSATKIITYDWCPVVNYVLRDSVERGSLEKLTVIDAIKNGPGMHHLLSLSQHKGYVEYGDLSSVGTIFERGSMVLLGCSSVLSSGRVCLPRGAFQLALVARANNVPVLVLSPTYKFVDRAQSASRFALVGRSPLDILPPDLITAIVTDIRLLPPSSAPAVLKAKALDDAN